MNEMSVTQPTQVPIELREMIINNTEQDPPTTDTQRTSHTALPTHSLSDIRKRNADGGSHYQTSSLLLVKKSETYPSRKKTGNERHFEVA